MSKRKDEAEDLSFRGGEIRGDSRGSVRILLSSTRFIASLFWLTIIVATMVFVLPYSERTQSPAFYAFVAMSIAVFLAHRYFPYEGYHPVAFFLLLLGTDALIALMVYLSGGSTSSLSLLFVTVIIFSSAYFDLLETMLITAVTCAVYFAPVSYEPISFEVLKNMAMAVPIFLIIALCGAFVISRAREQEREKQALTYLYDQADTKRQELSTLYAVSLKFASTLDEDEMMSILLDNAGELTSGDGIAVSLLDPSGQLSAKGYKNLEQDQVKLLNEKNQENPLYVSASAVLPVVLKDAEEDPRFEPFLRKLGFNSMIAVPLYASASAIGVLSCLSRQREAFDDDAARLLLTLASEAAVALEKASLYRTTLEDKTKIEAIINSLTDGLMVIDREANLVLANPYILRLMQLRPEDYDRPLPDLLERSEFDIEFKESPYRETLERVLVEGESLKNEMTLDTEPPTIFQVFWVPLKDSEGGISGAVILLHDITDFIELDRMKSDFISIVSHELKTPLTSIKGFLRLLTAERVGSITDKQRHYLEIVEKQSESLTTLIDDLLDLSKIEAGIIEVRHEPVALADVVGGVVQQLDNMAQEKDISLLIRIPSNLPEIDGDSERLLQVFMNLIHNAVKFTPHGGKVEVKASAMGKDCLVKVADNGIGISQQDLQRIFQKFYQVDSSSTRQQSGTGLGLAITKQLVTAHGGDLWVSSIKGGGTTFSLTLPFYVPKAHGEPGRLRDLGEAASG
jgi:signal transduction histidine kinase